jgi:hypothetical protein
MEDERREPKGWMTTGTADGQTVTPDWAMVDGPTIDGVAIKEIRSVATSTGYLTEIFREEWHLPHARGFGVPAFAISRQRYWLARTWSNNRQAVLLGRDCSNFTLRRSRCIADIRQCLAQGLRSAASRHCDHSTRGLARRNLPWSRHGAASQSRRQGIFLHGSRSLALAARYRRNSLQIGVTCCRPARTIEPSRLSRL